MTSTSKGGITVREGSASSDASGVGGVEGAVGRDVCRDTNSGVCIGLEVVNCTIYGDYAGSYD